MTSGRLCGHPPANGQGGRSRPGDSTAQGRGLDRRAEGQGGSGEVRAAGVGWGSQGLGRLSEDGELPPARLGQPSKAF